MRKKLLLFLLSVLFSGSLVCAQSVSQRFDNALDVYNYANKSLNDIENSQNIFDMLDTWERLDTVILDLQYCEEEFSSINKLGNDNYKFAAGYYTVLSVLRLGKAYNLFEKYDYAYKYLSDIKNVMNGTITIPLPIKYTYNGTNYQVNAEHLNNAKSGYYYEMYWTCMKLKKYDEEVSSIYSFLQFNNISLMERIDAINELIYLKDKNLYTFSQDGVIDFLIAYADVYFQLNSTERVNVLKNSIHKGIVTALTDLVAEVKVGNISTLSYSRLIPLLNKLSSNENSIEQLYDLLDLVFPKLSATSSGSNLVVSGTNTDYYVFLKNIDKVARRANVNVNSDPEGLGLFMDYLKAIEISKAKKCAIQANQFLAQKAIETNECNELSIAIANLEYWGDKTNAQKYSDLLPTCKELARKAELKRLRKIQRENSTFNIYAGIYPIGLIAKSENMDFGGVLNIVNNKSVIEFSYLKMQNKQENYFDLWIDSRDYSADDLPKWNGYYSHIQYKRLTNAPYYFGILGGYAQKSFSTFSENVTDNATSAVVSEVFTPYSKQYIFMLNEGYLRLFKGFGFDAFVGLGVTYNTFDLGSDVDRTTHTIDNPVLQYRKDNYFSFIARAGITIGLNIGNGVRKK